MVGAKGHGRDDVQVREVHGLELGEQREGAGEGHELLDPWNQVGHFWEGQVLQGGFGEVG